MFKITIYLSIQLPFVIYSLEGYVFYRIITNQQSIYHICWSNNESTNVLVINGVDNFSFIEFVWACIFFFSGLSSCWIMNLLLSTIIFWSGDLLLFVLIIFFYFKKINLYNWKIILSYKNKILYWSKFPFILINLNLY